MSAVRKNKLAEAASSFEPVLSGAARQQSISGRTFTKCNLARAMIGFQVNLNLKPNPTPNLTLTPKPCPST